MCWFIRVVPLTWQLIVKLYPTVTMGSRNCLHIACLSLYMVIKHYTQIGWVRKIVQFENGNDMTNCAQNAAWELGANIFAISTNARAIIP